MPRLALALGGLLAATLLTAAAPKAGTATRRPSAADEPAPSGVAPPADDAVIAGSCRLSKEQCVDYEGSFAAGDPQSRCKKARGTWADAACPADGRVGTCRVRETGTDNRVLTHFQRPVTEKAARAECKKQPRGVYLAR